MKKIAYIILMFLPTTLFAQDLHFTQFYASPLNLNPAFTGAGSCNRLGFQYRNQWAPIGNGYITNLVFYDHYLHNYKSGIGFQYFKDVAGTSAFRKDNLSGFFAHEVNFNRFISGRFGLQIGLQQNSVYYKDFLFGDQIARDFAPTSVEPIPSPKRYFDASTGFLIYTANEWLGLSYHHLTQPNEAMLAVGKSKLPYKLSVHGGGKVKIKDEGKEVSKTVYFNYALNYKMQKEFDQLDVGAYFTKDIFQAGLWYRGIPLFKSYKKGYPNNDAIALIMGIDWRRVKLAYSYDLTISWLTYKSGGAHEVSLSYQLCDPKSKKKKRRMVVSCPKF